MRVLLKQQVFFPFKYNCTLFEIDKIANPQNSDKNKLISLNIIYALCKKRYVGDYFDEQPPSIHIYIAVFTCQRINNFHFGVDICVYNGTST